MKRVVFALLVLGLSLPSLVLHAQNSQPTIAVSQIHAGMRGVAYTVFQGIKPEPMDVEVLGVLRNVNGPKGDIILIRLHGQKVEYTGVVAGMSGSPVYIDGKLAGALAFRIGEFSKEPIAGVTPIADMLEINALDKSPAEEASAAKPAITNAAGKTSGPGEPVALPGSVQTLAQYLKPSTLLWSSTDSPKMQFALSRRSSLRPVSFRSWARARSARPSSRNRWKLVLR